MNVWFLYEWKNPITIFFDSNYVQKQIKFRYENSEEKESWIIIITSGSNIIIIVVSLPFVPQFTIITSRNSYGNNKNRN